jgi:hypothetical protein
MSSSKQAREQFQLNDLEPQQDPKGGSDETFVLLLSDPGVGAATLLVPYFSVDHAEPSTSSTSWLGSRVISLQKG